MAPPDAPPTDPAATSPASAASPEPAATPAAGPLELAVIVGSTREGRFGIQVARWFTGLARRRADLHVDVIDLADVDLPSAWTREHSPSVADYLARLDRADAFVVITPEYNHSFPAALKQAVDLAHSQWHAKPVGFVSYGGQSGGLRAVEHLRGVFAELHATTVRDVVSLHNPWGLFEGDGERLEGVGAVPAAELLLDRVAWWGRALRAARRAEPYAA